MKKAEFLLLLDELFEVSPGTVKESDMLADFGGSDSLTVISLLALVDEHFGVRLKPDQLNECKSVASVMALLSDHLT